MRKIALLNTIEALNFDRTHPLWIMGGNFNMITHSEEKRGGRTKLDSDSIHFKSFIQKNWLIDLPFYNGTHTWNNKRSDSQQITSKLDRFLLSDNAIHVGGDFQASILPLSGSDHWPIALQWMKPGDAMKKPFRFEAFWLTHPSFKEMVTSAWNAFNPPVGSKMFQLQQHLKDLKARIKSWNHSTFGNIFQQQKILESKMTKLQQHIIIEGRTEALVIQEQALLIQLGRSESVV